MDGPLPFSKSTIGLQKSCLNQSLNEEKKREEWKSFLNQWQQVKNLGAYTVMNSIDHQSVH